MTASGIIIGVTGAPGSGKSTASRIFAELGARVAALDEIGHGLFHDPQVKEEIHSTFSAGVFRIIDGEVSREKLGALVFSNPDELAKLNALLHPRMVEVVKARLGEWRRSGEEPAFVIEGALLLEMGMGEMCDRIVLVKSSAETRIRRLASRRGWDERELRRRESAQMSDAEREIRADAVVSNDLGTEDFRQFLETLWKEWT